jgi:hypothetical protein
VHEVRGAVLVLRHELPPQINVAFCPRLADHLRHNIATQVV